MCESLSVKLLWCPSFAATFNDLIYLHPEGIEWPVIEVYHLQFFLKGLIIMH